MKKRREYIHCILDSAYCSSVGIKGKEELIEELIVQAIRQDVVIKIEDGVSYPLSYILDNDLEIQKIKLIEVVKGIVEEKQIKDELELIKIAEESIIKYNLNAIAMLKITDPFMFRDYLGEINIFEEES